MGAQPARIEAKAINKVFMEYLTDFVYFGPSLVRGDPTNRSVVPNDEKYGRFLSAPAGTQ